jgi:hypothetical protein
MKLKNAPSDRAVRRSTRVETTVAIELAASCRPLRKSNSSAIAISPATRTNERDGCHELRWSGRLAATVIEAARYTCFAVTVCTTLATSSHVSTSVLDQLVELLAVEIADGFERARASRCAMRASPASNDSSARSSIWPMPLAQREDRPDDRS